MESELHRRIQAAFPTKPVPSANEILYNEAPDYKGSFPVDEELAEIKTFFSGRDWMSIGPKDVFAFRHALSFFSPRALAYYTPAWLSCALAAPEETDTAEENMVSVLARERLDLWTENQQTVICDWITHTMNEWLETGFLSEGLKERCQSAIENVRSSKRRDQR